MEKINVESTYNPTHLLVEKLKSVQQVHGMKGKIDSNGIIYGLPEGEMEEIEFALDKVQSEFHEMQYKLEKLESFSHILGHDLRAPIRHIVSLSSMLESSLSQQNNSPSLDLVKKLRHSAINAIGIIEELRLLSMVRANNLKKETFNLEDILQDIFQLHEDDLSKHDAKIATDIVPEITAYKRLIFLLFDNLVRNAIRHGSQPLDLKISTRRQNNRIEITVSNSKPLKQDSHISNFQAFDKGQEVSDIESTGLGLFICQMIVDAHEGQITQQAKDDRFQIIITFKE